MDVALRERFELANQKPASMNEAEELIGAPSFGRAALSDEFNDLTRLARLKKWRLVVAVGDAQSNAA